MKKVDRPTAAHQTSETRSPTSLAKITQPVTPGSYLRERLFGLMDSLAGSAALWISAPAGYGKTTLGSTYLQSRGRPTSWYQCDVTDSDIASFFRHLSLARLSLTGDCQSLPAFSFEHLAQIPTFAINYFRAWFDGLPANAALVLDNFHEIPDNSPLPELLPAIVDQIPNGNHLIIISRLDPDPSMARHEVNRRLAAISVEELQLSRLETQEVAELLQSSSLRTTLDTPLEDIYQATQGWAAGVAIMLRHADLRSGRAASSQLTSRQSLFNYLAVEVFDSLEPDLRDFLLKTAYLEYVSPTVATRLTGSDRSLDYLQNLQQRNAFITYRPGSDSYYYHPLFREFLLKVVGEKMDRAQHQQLMIAAAHALLDCHDGEAAVTLLLQAESWQEAAGQVSRLAPALVQQVKFTTLAGWLSALPQDLVLGNGWLRYWQGVQQLATQFPVARETLVDAYRLFVDSGELSGQMLACTGVLQHIAYCYADCSPMHPWLERLIRLVEDCAVFPSAALELQIRSGLLLAIAVVSPDHPALLPTLERVTDQISGDCDTPSRAYAISALQHVYSGLGRIHRYRELEQQVTSVLADHSLGPAMRIRIMWLQAWQLHLSGEHDATLSVLDEALKIARHHNLVMEEFQVLNAQLQARDLSGSALDASNAFSLLEPMARQTPPIAASHFLYIRAMWELSTGNVASAVAYATEATQLVKGTSWSPAETMLWVGRAEILCELNRLPEARQDLDVCEKYLGSTDAPLYRFHVSLVSAEIERRAGNAAGFADALTTALSTGRRQGFAQTYHASSRLLYRLIVHALELNIEVVYCSWVIIKRRFKPPGQNVQHWPWKVQIRTLGRLAITLGNTPLVFSGKVQRRPMDVLKLLLSRRQGVAATTVMDMVWPDLDGDAARNALDLAVSRLRKLLEQKDAVLVSDGRLALNTDIVWVDAFAFEEMNGCLPAADPRAAAAQLLDDYRGTFLADSHLEPVDSARHRLRSLFLRNMKTVSVKLDLEADADFIASFFQQAVGIEPEEEIIYQEWIRHLVARGQYSEAENLYMSCERVLARTHGRKPSAATRLLLARAQPGAQLQS
jgi:LuxR family maltose regulon positive regulatory protein